MLFCNVIPRNDGFNIGLKCQGQNCCMEPSIAIGVWCRSLENTERTFVYPCHEHLREFLRLPYDGVHPTWFELHGRIILFKVREYRPERSINREP